MGLRFFGNSKANRHMWIEDFFSPSLKKLTDCEPKKENLEGNTEASIHNICL